MNKSPHRDLRLIVPAILLSLANLLPHHTGAQNGMELTAQQAVALALENNHGIRLARLDAEVAEILNTPGEAGMLPIIGIDGSYNINNAATRQEFFTGEVRETSNANVRALDVGLGAEWTIFDGLTMFATRERLAALEMIGRTELKLRIETTIHDVLSSYYLTVQLQKAIQVQQEGIRITRERLAIAEAGERIGSASGLAVVQARLDLSADSAAVLEMTAQAAMAENQLNMLLGQPPGTPIVSLDTIPPAEELDLGTIQQMARTNNTSLLQMEQLQLTNEIAVRELRGALLPRVSVYGDYGFTRSTSDVGFLQSNRSLGPEYGARLSIPLFNGGRANRAMRVARSRQEQAALSTDEMRLLLEQWILDGWTEYTVARQRVALEEANLRGTRQQVDVALESYRIGMLTAVELREVQQGHVDAENRLLLARYEAKMAELRLKMFAGRLV